MSQALVVTQPARHVLAFDEVVTRFANRDTSFTEVEALKQSHRSAPRLVARAVEAVVELRRFVEGEVDRD